MLILPQFKYIYRQTDTHTDTHAHILVLAQYHPNKASTNLCPESIFGNPIQIRVKIYLAISVCSNKFLANIQTETYIASPCPSKRYKRWPIIELHLGLGLNILSSEMTSTAPASLHPAEISIKIIQEYHSCFQGNLLTSALGILGTEVQKRTNVEEKALLT